jgi:IS30 family transposase
MNHKKLQPEERDRIAIWLSSGKKVREIARLLGRSPSTISDEIRRNSWKGTYVSIHAQSKSEKRRSASIHHHPLKNKSIYSYTMKKLRSGWSPEQIAGRLKLRHPDNGYWHIHHETIYRFIYAEENKGKKLWEYLPRKQKRRKKRDGRSCQRGRIPDRVSIHQRPESVEDRREFGHWEGDSIIGRGHRNGLHTEVERKSRYVQAVKLDRVGSDETVVGQRAIFDQYPEGARKTTTLDNGKEFVKHMEFGITAYFADPYSSWQRGCNEYHNGLIRRYLPKGTDFNLVTQEELDEIIEEINNRPRKCLGYKTPKEVFEEELQNFATVRIQCRM